MTATRASLSWLADVPGRCPQCFFAIVEMGHRSQLDDGSPTGCADVGQIHESEQRRLAGRAHVEADTSAEEWRVFAAALKADAAAHNGVVSQNRIRMAIGHRWVSVTAKRRYSQMWSKARRELGLVETGQFEKSTDRAGGNAHRSIPLMKLEAA